MANRYKRKKEKRGYTIDSMDSSSRHCNNIIGRRTYTYYWTDTYIRRSTVRERSTSHNRHQFEMDAKAIAPYTVWERDERERHKGPPRNRWDRKHQALCYVLVCPVVIVPQRPPLPNATHRRPSPTFSHFLSFFLLSVCSALFRPSAQLWIWRVQHTHTVRIEREKYKKNTK